MGSGSQRGPHQAWGPPRRDGQVGPDSRVTMTAAVTVTWAKGDVPLQCSPRVKHSGAHDRPLPIEKSSPSKKGHSRRLRSAAGGSASA